MNRFRMLIDLSGWDPSARGIHLGYFRNTVITCAGAGFATFDKVVLFNCVPHSAKQSQRRP